MGRRWAELAPSPRVPDEDGERKVDAPWTLSEAGRLEANAHLRESGTDQFSLGCSGLASAGLVPMGLWSARGAGPRPPPGARGGEAGQLPLTSPSLYQPRPGP